MLETKNSTLLSVSNVSKTYRVFDSPAQRLKDLIGLYSRHENVTALKPLNFKVEHGETVAIVGSNGSGKSTLLQLICGTLTATTGSIERGGRIAALLELGAGFNPEFTGLDNVFLNASINGLSREKTKTLLPSILAFADIGEHVYQPVKTYSSGMYVRLAFAVAIHVEPELLIIDEALAVGDEAFQRKCFARLRTMQEQGVSILFVSHSAESVVSLCDRALLLDQGELLLDGEPKQVVALYQKLLYAKPEQRLSVRAEILDKRSPSEKSKEKNSVSIISSQSYIPHPYDFIPGLEPETTDYSENGATISDVVILDEEGRQVNILHKGRRYHYRYQVHFYQPAQDVFFSTLIKRLDGVSVGGYCSTPPNLLSGRHFEVGESRWVEFELPITLNTGTYFINAGVQGRSDNHDGFLARKLDALMFKVLSTREDCATGTVDLGFSINDFANAN